MSDAHSKPLRPWPTIAQELSKERDAERVLELARELDEALKREFALLEPNPATIPALTSDPTTPSREPAAQNLINTDSATGTARPCREPWP